MTTLKYLITFTSGVAVALFAWMLWGGTCLDCHETAMAGMRDLEESNRLHQEEVDRYKQVIEKIRAHDTAIMAQVKELEEQAKKSHAELEQIRATSVQQTAEVQRLTKDWGEQNAGLVVDLHKALDERDHAKLERDVLKASLKAMRQEYIAVANKLAAVEEVELKRLADQAKHVEHPHRQGHHLPEGAVLLFKQSLKQAAIAAGGMVRP